MIIGASSASHGLPLADDAPLSGNWKLVVLPYGDDEFAIVKLSEKDGKTTGSVADAQQMMGRPALKAVERKGGVLTLTLNGAGASTVFQGQAREGWPGAPASSWGRSNFRGATYPARLEPTKDIKGRPAQAKPACSPRWLSSQTRAIPRPRSRSSKRRSSGNHGHPNSALLYAELLETAQAAGIDVAKVKDVVKRWIDEARPYGDEWLNDIRLRALGAIASSKSLAKLTVELAQEAEQGVSDTDIETKATVLACWNGQRQMPAWSRWPRKAKARHAKLEHHARRGLSQEGSPVQTGRVRRSEREDG